MSDTPEPLNYSEAPLPDGLVIGCPWPHTIVTWKNGSHRGATKPEHDLWRHSQKLESDLMSLHSSLDAANRALAEAGLVQMGLYQEKENLTARLAEVGKDRDEWMEIAQRHAKQVAAAQADVVRLTEERDQAIKCAKGWIDEFYRVVGERDSSLSQFAAAASREAALVEALKNSRVILDEGEPHERSLDGPFPSAEKQRLHDTYWSRHTTALELTDAALARCSPPAAETEIP